MGRLRTPVLHQPSLKPPNPIASCKAKKLTLRNKTLAIIVATLVGLLLLLYVGYNTAVMQSFLQLEEHNTEGKAQQLLDFINNQAYSLNLQIKDWAHWDDTYAFAQTQTPAFIELNLTASTFANLRLNLMVFIDTDGQIMYSQAYDLSADAFMAPPANLQTFIDRSPLLRATPTVPTSGVYGLLTINNLPMMVATSPILTSEAAGPSHGTLLWGRYLTEDVLQQLTGFIRAPLAVALPGAPDLPPDMAAVLPSLSVTQPVAARQMDDNTIGGYGLLANLYGQPGLLLRMALPRDIYQHGLLTMSWFTMSLVIVGVSFAAVFLILLERLVLSRLVHLSRQVEGISASQDFSARLDDRGSDELSKLAHVINSSLVAAAESQTKLKTLNESLERRVAARTAELERELLFQEAILNSMNEGVLYGTEESIEYTNEMVSELSGYSSEALIGKPQSLIFTLPNRVERQRLLTHESGGDSWIQRGERKLRRSDGKVVDIAFTVTPLVGGDSGPKQIVIFRDITEEKVLQARRDRFLANASHELRTPLTNLITRLYLLRRQPEQFQTHVDILDKVAAHMKSLIEDLLDVSRFNKGTLSLKRERMKLAPLIREVVEIQIYEAINKKQTLTTYIPNEDILVFVDRKRFIQVLTNLIFNAINYTPEGGKIDVSLTTETTETATFALLRVSDTGVGIEPENLDQIFQPFFRASQELPGTGLGLAIVKEIVTRHGGAITVESTPGEGTTFTIRLGMLTPSETTESQDVAQP
jgi:PAS domain S-box-containing protein